MEGLVFSGKTGKLLLKTPMEKEERVYLDSKSPHFQKQILDIDIKTVTELAQDLISTIGKKAPDSEPPLLDIKKPQDAQVIRTTVTLLTGEITDKSKVFNLNINGEEKDITPGRLIKLYYPVRYIYGKEKERITLSVLAKDIYGNTSSRSIGLIWGKPIWATITKVSEHDILINAGTRQGVTKGMTFMACNVETYKDPVTGNNMFHFVEVGPVIVKKAYDSESECTFIESEKSERMKKGDIVR